MIRRDTSRYKFAVPCRGFLFFVLTAFWNRRWNDDCIFDISLRLCSLSRSCMMELIYEDSMAESNSEIEK